MDAIFATGCFAIALLQWLNNHPRLTNQINLEDA
jgi:hypothetical protein